MGNDMEAQAGKQQETWDKLARMTGYLAQDPENPPLLLEVIDLCLETGQVGRARETLNSARSLFPEDVFIRQREGHVLMAEENWLAASAVFERLLEQYPDAALAYNLGYAYFRLARYADAQGVLEPYLQAMQGQAPVAMVTLMLRCLHHCGEVERALALQQAYAASCGGDSAFLSVSSLLLLDANQLEAAQRACSAALAGPNPSLEAVVTGGTLALAHGELAQAMQFFEQALVRKPDDGRSLSGIGLVLLMQRDYVAASEQLARAIEAMPEHIGTRHILGWCKIMMQDLPAAQSIFAASLELDHNFGESHGTLAVVAAMRGQRDEAQAYARRAQRLDPGCLSVKFAKLLLSDDGHDPAKLNAAVQGLLAQQTGPFGGSLTEMLVKMTR